LHGKPGALITKDALLDEVWGHQCVSESVLKTVIRKLRFVLNDDARQPRFIETVSQARVSIHCHREPYYPRRQRPLARVAEISSPQAPSFIGRAEPLSRLRPRLGCRVQRQARGCLGRRRTGYRQDDADRALCGRT
jgi:hypothetical protein